MVNINVNPELGSAGFSYPLAKVKTTAFSFNVNIAMSSDLSKSLRTGMTAEVVGGLQDTDLAGGSLNEKQGQESIKFYA